MPHASARPSRRPARAALASSLSAVVAVSALAVPSGAAARPADPSARAGAAGKTAVRRSAKTVTTRAGLKRPKSISRSCGRSRSASKVRRRTSTASKTTLRVTTRYCSGRVLVQTTRLVAGPTRTVPGPTVNVPIPVPVPVPVPGSTTTVPGPTVEVPAAPKEKSFRLTLLHNNDGESKYAPTRTAPLTGRLNYGGVDRFATVLKNLRSAADAHTTAAEKAGAETKGTLTVSSGDNFLAGLNLRASFARFDAGQGPWYDSTALDLLGYDAATIGNHEFDFGPARLAQFIGGTTRTQFVSANTDLTQEPTLQALRTSGKIANSTVVEKGGERIGVIGVTPPETPTVSSPGKVVFDSAVASVVNAEAKRLTDAGVSKIVLSSHLQSIANERALVPQLENVDIVIAGGGDDLLANSGDALVPTDFDDPAKGTPTPVGNYPLRLADKTGRVVPVVTTAGEYNYVGRLTVTFDKDGRIDQVDGTRSGPVRVSGREGDADAVAPDPALASQVVQPLAAYRQVADSTILGSATARLDGDNPNPIRLRESNLGNLVADAFRFSVLDAQGKGAIAQNGLQTVGLANGGGIRASIAAGNVSQGQTFDVLPFNNVISRVPSVPAAQLKDLLEFSVAALPNGNGRFGQISGMRVEYDTSQQPIVLNADGGGGVVTPGQRIRTITLDDGTKIVEGGALVAGAPAVNIATTDFTARGGQNGNGGDGYPFRKPTVQPVGIAYQQSLEDFITAPTASGGLNRSISGPRYATGGDGRLRNVTP